MTPDRWELGSEFHWPTLAPGPFQQTLPTLGESRLYGCGRDALRAVLEHGMTTRGWRRLLGPSYMCQDVLASAASSGLPIETYPDRPGSAPPELTPAGLTRTDVVLEVNFFGLRGRPFVQIPEGIDVIEDHTHDPWSQWARESRAAFAFASLRKTLPLPSGGVVWSPARLELPAPRNVTTERRLASADKLKAMLLKSLYLAGHDVAKTVFRELAVSSEAMMSAGPVSGMPPGDRPLGVFPIDAWRLIRHRNHSHLAERLQNTPGLSVLRTEASGSVPFSFVGVFDEPGQREAMREHLLRRDIYPTVLWPLDNPVVAGIGVDDLALSQRMLSIHCDWRYSIEDMDTVAEVVQAGMTQIVGRESR